MDERTPDPWLTDGSLRRRWPLACISSMRCSTACQCQRFLRRLVGVMSAKTDGGRHSVSGLGNKLCILLSDEDEQSVDFHQNLANMTESFYGRRIFRSFPGAVQQKHNMMSMCAQLMGTKTPQNDVSYVNTKPEWLWFQDWPLTVRHTSPVLF